ncbi:MAG TPA: flagellar basal body P-ring formation chaperone FlgA [Bryobacteraceae bacterium]|nr:flagellar basal body P-ring formation chaperone FlgA [Bryobacteraceae bacterium]
MKQLCVILLSIVPLAAGCVQLAGGQIRAGDLAGVVPAFANADPSTVLSPSPAPGVRRLMTLRDLRWVARRLGAVSEDLPGDGVCLERELRELTEGELVTAMMGEFPNTAVRIDVVEFFHFAVPRGRIVFPLSGLSKPSPSQPDAPVIWRGRLVYDEGRSVQIWARVTIRAPATVLVAAVDIRAGQPILPEQVRRVEVQRFPQYGDGALSRIEQVTGTIARRPIQGGQVLSAPFLDRPPEVRVGEMVRILAVVGRARISLSALSVSNGRRGDTVVLRNPDSHASFRAVVDGEGSAVIRSAARDRS